MIDLSDIENAIVAKISQALTGVASSTTAPAAAPNVLGIKDAAGQTTSVRAMRGFPISAAVDADMKAGHILITVGPEQGMTRILPLLKSPASVVRTVPVTVTATVDAPVVTFSGTATAGQLVGVGVGGTGYAIRCQGGENANQIATAIAMQINGAQVSQNQIYVPGDAPLVAMAVGDTIMREEVGRQVQAFRITVYAPTPALRDAIGRYLGQTLLQVRSFELDHGVTNRPKYLNVWTDDQPAKVNVFKRVERWEVEYPTNSEEVVSGVLFAGLNRNGRLVGRFHPAGPITIERTGNV